MYNCKICNNYSSKNLKHGFAQHVSMLHSMSPIEYFIRFENFEIPKCKCGSNCRYKSGLTFGKTCGDKICIFNHQSEVQKISSSREEIRIKRREARLAYMKANPHDTAWRTRKNQSWPEKFFEEECIKRQLDKNFEIVKEFSVFPFYVDFAFINIKVAVEIDGSQHKLPERLVRDNKKDKVLNENGWRVFRIEANLMYDESTRNEVFDSLNEFISKFDIKKSDCSGIISHSEKKKLEKQLKIQLKKEKQMNEIAVKIKKILDSQINFSRHGWVQKASKLIDISPQKTGSWMKRHMFDFYNENCFVRYPYGSQKLKC